jgi:SOS response regulatory protein OraA/RecX
MDLTQITEIVITLAVAVTTAFLVPYIKTKLTTEQTTELASWIDIAVNAAEKIFTETKAGAAKKQYVLNFLESKGYSINSDEIDNMIESAVNKLTTALKE